MVFTDIRYFPGRNLIACGRGIVNSFGVYQTYYQNELLSTMYSSQISWIGSIQAFLLLVTGVATGPLFDRGYLNSLLLAGGFLTILGIMMTSICNKYWQVILAQGVCLGLGAGCLFVPSIAVVSVYFTTKRALATGLAVGGGSIGGIIYPITFHALQPSLGFGWTTRVLGLITLALLATSIAVMWTRLPPKPPRAMFMLSAFESWAFTFQCVGFAIGFIGLYVPMFYIQVYALTRGDISSVDYAFYLLPVLNAGSFFGRIIPNALTSYTGPLNMLVLCTFASGILCLCWTVIENTAGLTVFAVLYGFFAGAYVSLSPPVIVALTPNMSVVGTYMGMSIFVAAFGLLIGNPIVGSLVDVAKQRFVPGQAFAGGTILLGGVLMLIALVIRARQVQIWKV